MVAILSFVCIIFCLPVFFPHYIGFQRTFLNGEGFFSYAFRMPDSHLPLLAWLQADFIDTENFFPVHAQLFRLTLIFLR